MQRYRWPYMEHYVELSFFSEMSCVIMHGEVADRNTLAPWHVRTGERRRAWRFIDARRCTRNLVCRGQHWRRCSSFSQESERAGGRWVRSVPVAASFRRGRQTVPCIRKRFVHAWRKAVTLAGGKYPASPFRNARSLSGFAGLSLRFSENTGVENPSRKPFN